MSDKEIHWNGGVPREAVDRLVASGGLVVSATKVGYIIMTTDGTGLERKFEAKERNRNKPGVVLCGSFDELRELAQMNPEIEALYQKHWDDDVLLGCILPWNESAESRIPNDGARDLMMDRRGTSCFVIRFGGPAELIARDLWETHGRIAFASSANPSGRGNRGVLRGIGERIYSSADVIVEADDYVHSIQPSETHETRYEQGVMVSLVDGEGALIPLQDGERSVEVGPVLIRAGLDVDRIMLNLADVFPSWNYRQGEYY